MRVYLSSTPDELAPYRAAAERIVRGLGWEAVARGTGASSAGTIESALGAIDEAGLVLSIVGWGRGPVPAPELGGDGVRPWAQWEMARAFRRFRPAVVLMASESWPAREESPESSSAVADFRAELAPLALPFEPEPEGVGGFEKLLRSELESRSTTASRPVSGPAPRPASAPSTPLGLRVWPQPALPAQPWPVLLPYSHPDLLAGRDRELAELIERLDLPLPILGLHAASGSGKSSLLQGGLVPRLRSGGRAVALDRHPAEPGFAARLVGDLLEGAAEALAVSDMDHETFVARLLTARKRAGDRPPILVLDQLEDVLRGSRQVRAAVGTLLAATAQRRPGVDGPLCRWLLGYRREYHGQLLHWLNDPLREARALGIAGAEELPHDLASLDRFHDWALPPLGSAPPGSSDLAKSAGEAFLAAITAPLALVDDRGLPRYPWRFEGDGAERLARAFGEARVRQPSAPLAPELQVVLAHLVEAAGEPAGPDAPATLVVPADPGRLIDDALEEHLGRALEAAFPASDRTGRTRALLALRELADAGGRRGVARPGDDLARAIGREGPGVLEKMQAPGCRLVVAERRGDDVAYSLSHDRLAEVVVRAVEGPDGGGRLAVDPELLALHRFVSLQADLYRSGERDQATRVSAKHVSGIEAHADTLLADDERRRWWKACLVRHRADRRRRRVTQGIAAVLVLLGGWAAWSHAARKAARETLLQQVATAAPAAALPALVAVRANPEIPIEAGLAALRRRANPFDLLAEGLSGVPATERAAAVLATGETFLTLLDRLTSDDPLPLATFLWAVDFAAGHQPATSARAIALADRALAPLRKRHPPPPADAFDWVAIPAGSFHSGTGNGSGPEHVVTVSAFRIQRYETTVAEYRRLHPEHPGVANHPAVGLSWAEATVYAGWLGGRLPTDAEWEYMARAGCRFEHCRRDGSEASVGEVAWTIPASAAATGKPETRPVGTLEPNPWGLYDVYGNAFEWVADWSGAIPSQDQVDPQGPAEGEGRIGRGGGKGTPAASASPARRVDYPPDAQLPAGGVRPCLRAGLPGH